MATIKQIDANRRNSQLSTGPRTEEGKQSASRNALKTGIYAESEVIPGEHPEALAALAAEYHSHHRPATPEARDLVDSLVRNAWLLRRLAAAEAATFNCDCDPCRQAYEGFTDVQVVSGRLGHNMKRLDMLQRRINATERNFHRSLKALRDLPLDPQPIDPEPVSEKLALFPQPVVAPAQTLEQPAPSSISPPSSTSCASYASSASSNSPLPARICTPARVVISMG